MTFADLEAAVADRQSLRDDAPPLVRALWHDATGDWDRAHALAQEVDSRDGAWVHAYLHRREGDLDNARYWYRRAGRVEAKGPLEDEWRDIARVLVGQGPAA
jgi:hypothetical protein